MAARNIPSAPLQPQFGIRPVSTKYALLPIVDRRAPASVPIEIEPTYNPEIVFNPGSAHAPWSGFASSVNEESSLRNQFFGLQRCEQGEYIPSTKSQLYNADVPAAPVPQPFPLLFTAPQMDAFDPDPCHLAPKLFNNSTREAVLSLGIDAAAAAASGRTKKVPQ
tara:strand:+ start:144 stop:638 length:495 start_codon:yes stop_codon:yes gene_type:complete